MAGRKHLVAVNRAIKSANLDEMGLDAPIVELARDLARRLDTFTAGEAPLNLMRSYLSATKDLSRANARKARPTSAEPRTSTATASAPAKLHAVEENPLAKARRQAGRAS